MCTKRHTWPYFQAVYLQKCSSFPQTPCQGFAPGLRWGTSVPQTPYLAPQTGANSTSWIHPCPFYVYSLPQRTFTYRCVDVIGYLSHHVGLFQYSEFLVWRYWRRLSNSNLLQYFVVLNLGFYHFGQASSNICQILCCTNALSLLPIHCYLDFILMASCSSGCAFLLWLEAVFRAAGAVACRD